MKGPHGTSQTARILKLLVAGAVMAAILAATPVTASERIVDAADDARELTTIVQGAEEFGPFTPTLVDVADAAVVEPPSPEDPVIDRPRQKFRGDIARPGEPVNPTTWSVDPLLELQEGASRDPDRALATPTLSIAGQPYTSVNPPDTVGDVGPTYYVQAVNHSSGSQVAMYLKSTGAMVLGPFLLDSLGSGSCADGGGDPIVLYDHLASRWLISEFADTGNALCVYVSQTDDPTGSYYAYNFSTPNFPDYPKYSVWPDAYYVTSNEFSPAVYALDRSQMLAGLAATSQRFTAPFLAGFSFQALTPADVDGPAPPGGTPGLFMRHRDDEVHNAGSNDPTSDFLDMFEFTVDWVTPANSTFIGPVSIPMTEIDSDLCGLFSFECFPQPGTGVTLDPLREVVMWRLVYRNFGAHEKLVGNLVTDVDGTDHGGVRWFELRRSGANPWTVHQEGTYAPDAHSRWMGAIAMDQNANIALGYNVVSETQNPDLRYVGRQASDPLGTMPDGEHTLAAAGGFNGSNRWGDYSAMSIDPVDGCTFWFTGMTATAGNVWATQIGAFKFDSCAPDGLNPTVTITTPSDGASYTQGAVVLAAYSCADEVGGSGIDSCVGDVADGAPIDTATAGSKTFTVTGTDHAGNVTTVIHTYTVVQQADISVSKSLGAGEPIPGTSITYFVDVVNIGPSDDPSVTLTDLFSADHISCTWVVFGSSGGVAGQTPGGPGDLTQTLSMPANSDIFYDVTCDIDPGATGTLTNTATVTGSVPDPNPGNNSATANNTLTPEADLSITKTDSPDAVKAGETLTYTVRVDNNGPSFASGVTVTDTLAAGVTYGSDTDSCTESPAGTLTCDLGTIAAGASSSFDVTVTVDTSTPAGTISNTATVSSDTSDPDTSNNTATEDTTVAPEADLSITKTDSPDPVLAGDTLTYTVTVDNAGPSDATGVTVTDTLAAGVTYGSDTDSCTESPAGTLTCDLGTIASGASSSFDVTVTVDAATTPGTITNTATVSSDTSDPDPSNNTATEDTTVAPEADLSITKTDSADPVRPGEFFTYTVTVGNTGQSTATGVTVVDTLPFGLIYDSNTAAGGCVNAPAGTLTCALGSLAPAGSASFDIRVQVELVTFGAGIFDNTVVVSADETDPDLTNNTATERTDVTLAPKDQTAPTVAFLTPPDGATYVVGETVLADYSCADEPGGSGLLSCLAWAGPSLVVGNGAPIDTSTAGVKALWVQAFDNVLNNTSVTHNYTVVAPPPPPIVPDTVGVVNIDNAQWYLANSTGAVTNFEYGNPTDLPISGDWDANPTSTPGLYRSLDSGGLPGGFFYARNFNSTGIANDACFGGNPSDIPVSGDWDGDGDDTLGIMRLVNNQPTFFLFNNSCVGTAPQSNPFQNALGAAQISFEFGDAGDTPVVGDWDGDGQDEIGLYRRSNGFFYNRETLSTGVAHNACFAGDPSDYPIGGDWDGDGDGNFGIFRPADQKFFLFTTSCVGLAPQSNPFANAMGAAQLEVPVPVTTDTAYLASLVAADKLRPVSGAFGLG